MLDDINQPPVPNERATSARWWPAVCILLVGGTILLLLHLGLFAFTGRPSADVSYTIWAIHVALFIWLLGYSRLDARRRALVLAAICLVDASVYLAIRVDGYGGDGRIIFAWRWTPTPAERFEEARRFRPTVEPADGPTVDLKSTTPHDYPGFRGSDRSGVISGVHLATNWGERPPRRLWRQPVGAGWSSFAIVDHYAVTQEQRREFEAVVCYELQSGRECWIHADRANFYEVTGGRGPRATPTIHDGRVYSLGATGILNCLDGSSGRRLWSTQILEDNGGENALFGMAGSPLVIDGMVIVAPGAPGNSLVAYDERSGRKIWGGGDAAAAYSAPQACRITGRAQVLNFNAEGLFAHDLHDGRVLWSVPWISNPEERNNVCQPIAFSAEAGETADRVFISSGYDRGSALFAVSETDRGFVVRELWSNRHLKAKFTSVVASGGHVYGLDERILTCLDLQTGERCWKGGRYGHGQVILVGNVLVIQAETGEIALVDASPAAFHELARFPGLDDRTWNHPALAGDLLVIRNDREAACYQLPLSSE